LCDSNPTLITVKCHLLQECYHANIYDSKYPGGGKLSTKQTNDSKWTENWIRNL